MAQPPDNRGPVIFLALLVLVGLLVIIGAGQCKVVSFEHVFPTLVPKG